MMIGPWLVPATSETRHSVAFSKASTLLVKKEESMGCRQPKQLKIISLPVPL
jgi:hypothetical protein